MKPTFHDVLHYVFFMLLSYYQSLPRPYSFYTYSRIPRYMYRSQTRKRSYCIRALSHRRYSNNTPSTGLDSELFMGNIEKSDFNRLSSITEILRSYDLTILVLSLIFLAPSWKGRNSPVELSNISLPQMIFYFSLFLVSSDDFVNMNC